MLPYPPMLPSTWYGNECNAKSLEDNSKQSKLHVMIMYRGASCVHTALRVYCRSNGSLFWDPAGGFASRHRYAGQARRYRRYEAPVNEGPVRENDVLVEKAPSLNQYLDIGGNVLIHMLLRSSSLIFQMSRRKKSGLLFVMVPNVHILKADLVQMQWGGLCGLSVAKYLHRFAEDIVKVDVVWHPHSLAKQLYKENPDRVIIYRDEQLSYYIPSENYVE